VVGRELRMMCPPGEDHQGHDWGGGANGDIDSRGRRSTNKVVCGWRRWRIVKVMNKVLI